MAALPVNVADQEASRVRYLLEFTKFQQENPGLDPNQCAETFLSYPSKIPLSSHQPGATERSSAIEINKNLAALPDFKPESCPQSGTTPLAGSQRMARGNSTQANGVSTQNAFAIRAGRSPQQFQHTNPISLSSSFPQRENVYHHHHHHPPGAPSSRTLQSLGIDSNSAPALEEYLGQNNKHEPFHGLSRGNVDNPSGSGRARMMKSYPTLTIDPTLDSFSAPQMRHQLSSSASDYFTGVDEGYLDSPGSLSFPMARHSRSYSHGSFNSSLLSSSQADSASPTDHLVFGQHPGSYPMSRQASGASFMPNELSMLRVRSSTGSSIADRGDVDNLLSGIGGFAGENGDVSSLSKASAQIVLKRTSSMSVEDLDDSMMKGGQHHPRLSYSSSPSNPRKQSRIEKNEGETVNSQSRKNTDAAGLEKQFPKKIPKTEVTTKVDKGFVMRQSEKKGSGGSRHLPTIKPGKNPNNAPMSTSKSSYIRPPHPRVYCDKCSAHPDGFRGDHELRRHTDREHALTRKMFVIKDISKGKTLLAKCKSCQSGKKYGVDYNAAAHLRRQHFKPKTRNGKNKQKVSSIVDQTVPGMAELRKWMDEVEVRVETRMDDELYIKGGQKQNEDPTRSQHEWEDKDESSEEDDEEEAQQMNERANGQNSAYQEVSGQKIQQQQQNMEVFQEMELELDSGNLPLSDLTWDLSSWSGSTLNNSAYTLSNSQMPQELTHEFDFHVSATTGSVPLMGGVFNHQDNLGTHLSAQHTQMLMQENLLLQSPSYIPESNSANFSSFVSTTSRPTVMFNDALVGFPDIFHEIQGTGDLKTF